MSVLLEEMAVKQTIASQRVFLVLAVLGTAPLTACAYAIPSEGSMPPPSGNIDPSLSPFAGPLAPSQSPVDVPRQAPREQQTVARASARASLPPLPPATPVLPALAPQLPQLMGLEPQAVAEQLGAATAVETNSLSLVWTYARTDCTLRLFFYPDIENLAFHVLKYRLTDAAGEEMADENVCMRTFAEGVR